MAFVERASPAPGSYNFVLIRYDWPPNQVYNEAIYGEVARSRCIALPVGWKIPDRFLDRLIKPRPNMTVKPAEGGGREVAAGTDDQRSACMMFVQAKPLRTRLVKLGWLEVTDQWTAHVATLDDGEVEDLKKLAADKERVKPPGRPAVETPPEEDDEDDQIRSRAERVTSIPTGRGGKRRTVPDVTE
jgi:hypothetical protein